MDKIELLAPAGSMESLIAAVQSGADAVYLGGNNFSARAYASNFDDENMEKAIDYCHLYGVKVYITMNTLIKENEMEAAINYAAKLYSFGVDALIVQDTGLAYLLNKYIPQLELHASTQMTIHNGEAALYFKNIGFKRIVLSRELSLKEIEHISKDFNIETEMFIHGALCICYSGQCLMSSVIGGRSGNRGRCAQPCRMEYSLYNKESKVSKKGYFLSPKDICTIENVKEVIETGTSSLKIEGRMKRPEYVAGVVDIYRKAIDSEYDGTSFDLQNSYKTLLKLFNREGFSKGYMFGNKGKDMMAYSFPKNTGIILGKVGNNSIVKLSEQLNKGDGIRIGMGEDGFVAVKIFKNGKVVETAFSGDEVVINPTKYKEKDVLYKTSDNVLLSKLKLSYERPLERKINVPLKVKFIPDEKFELTALFKSEEIILDGVLVEKALNKAVTEEKIIENLSKSSETPIKFSPIHFSEYKEGFLPISAINNLRRESTELIESKLKVKNDLVKVSISPSEFNYKETKLPKVLIYVNSRSQFEAAKELGFEDICVDIYSKDIEFESKYLKVPSIIKNEFEQVCATIEENLVAIKGIITANAGIINRFKGKTNIIGDYKLNLFNSHAISLFDASIIGSCLSVELNKNEINSMVKHEKNCYQVLLYGKPELMVSEYCPVGSMFGGKSENQDCKRDCDKGNYILKDRKGEEFSITHDKFCRTHIYNNVPINLIPNKAEIMNMGINCFRLDFLEEGYEETIQVLNNFKTGSWLGEYKNYTRGHFKRGVE